MGRIFNVGISLCVNESVQCLGTSKFETLMKIQQSILLAWILNTHVYAIAFLYFGSSNYDVLGMLGEPVCNLGIQNDSVLHEHCDSWNSSAQPFGRLYTVSCPVYRTKLKITLTWNLLGFVIIYA